MNLHIILVFILFLSCKVNAQSILEKVSSLTPPDGVHLYDNIFIDQTAITNINWQEFLYHVKNDSSQVFYENCINDTNIWVTQQVPTLNDSYYNFSYRYYGNYRYRYHPVVGVTHCQAKRYCEWRSKLVTQIFNEETKYSKRLRGKGWDDYYIVFKYRLPTEEELEFAAANGLGKNKYPYGMKKIYRKHFWGNYTTFQPKDKSLPNEAPKKWIGFRCVVEIHLFKKGEIKKGDYPFTFEYPESCDLINFQDPNYLKSELNKKLVYQKARLEERFKPNTLLARQIVLHKDSFQLPTDTFNLPYQYPKAFQWIKVEFDGLVCDSMQLYISTFYESQKDTVDLRAHKEWVFSKIPSFKLIAVGKRDISWIVVILYKDGEKHVVLKALTF